MTKAQILAEIRRTAEENSGGALGQRTFARETGIESREWLGVYWRSWSDAVQEAGLTANKPTLKIEDETYLSQYVKLAREIDRLPTQVDVTLKKRRDSSFPSRTAFRVRFRSYAELHARAQEFCRANPDFADVLPLFSSIKRKGPAIAIDKLGSTAVGYVYMVKHGARPEYKIGMTRNPLRRVGEVAIELPEKLDPVHYIATDDPAGIEAYWHNRFAVKRKRGEWFALTRDDVAAFKRWKKIT